MFGICKVELTLYNEALLESEFGLSEILKPFSGSWIQMRFGFRSDISTFLL